MWVDPKNTGEFTECNDSSIRVFKQCLVIKYRSLDLFLNHFLFSVWVPISEKRKENPRNLYLGALVKIVKSFYSEGSTSVSGSASAYVRSGSTSNSVSGSESTISPIINLN
jgi:hypothetical protein